VESERRFRAMADSAPVLIWIAGLDKLCFWFNKVWLDFTGRSMEQEKGNGWAEGVHPDDFQRCLDIYVTSFDARKPFSTDYRLRRHDGEYRWITDNGVPRFDDNGHFAGYIGSCIDVTDRHKMEEQAQHMAFYDPLTSLPNRRVLDDRLAQMMAVSKRGARYCALMFLDLDNFKPLNDTYGHEAGDLLLVQVAERLKESLREVDTVARVGGDEFVVLLGELHKDQPRSAAQAAIVAEKIRARISMPYVVKVRNERGAEITIEHTCTASIGVTLFINHESSPVDVLKWADAAMYKAKDAGRNTICFHDPEP
jgi:diguanylate cyclase (GGDEF)-like protein/PAS domain S-box-containing protein